MNERYILEGKIAAPVDDILIWAKFMEDGSRRVVKQDRIGGVLVSTVFIGLNYAFDDREPILFETMVFGGDHDEYQVRYSTYEEAECGHKQILIMLFGQDLTHTELNQKNENTNTTYCDLFTLCIREL